MVVKKGSLTKASSVGEVAHYLVSRQRNEQTATVKAAWALEENKNLKTKILQNNVVAAVIDD